MTPFPPRGFTAKSDFTVFFFFLEGLCIARGILIYPFINNALTFYSISPKIKSLNCSFFAHCPYTLVGTVFAQSDTQRKKYSHVERIKHGLTGGRLGPFSTFCVDWGTVQAVTAHRRGARSSGARSSLLEFTRSQETFKQISGMALTVGHRQGV